MAGTVFAGFPLIKKKPIGVDDEDNSYQWILGIKYPLKEICSHSCLKSKK